MKEQQKSLEKIKKALKENFEICKNENYSETDFYEYLWKMHNIDIEKVLKADYNFLIEIDPEERYFCYKLRDFYEFLSCERNRVLDEENAKIKLLDYNDEATAIADEIYKLVKKEGRRRVDNALVKSYALELGYLGVMNGNTQMLVAHINRKIEEENGTKLKEEHFKKERSLTSVQQKEVINRDRVCKLCGTDNIKLLQVHHIIPRSKGGKNNDKNLITLCYVCHKQVHSSV